MFRHQRPAIQLDWRKRGGLHHEKELRIQGWNGRRDGDHRVVRRPRKKDRRPGRTIEQGVLTHPGIFIFLQLPAGLAYHDQYFIALIGDHVVPALMALDHHAAVKQFLQME